MAWVYQCPLKKYVMFGIFGFNRPDKSLRHVEWLLHAVMMIGIDIYTKIRHAFLRNWFELTHMLAERPDLRARIDFD